MRQMILERIAEIGRELDRLERNRGTSLQARQGTRFRMLKLIAERIQLRTDLIAVSKAG